MSYTLKHLLENYRVMIPQIQRDYAQGRESEVELRKGFISKIAQILSHADEVLNLDFIYGYTESTGASREVFIPLDGQQRLTTLWLMHWILAPRTDDGLREDVKQYLSQFTYETRISSKRFCTALINQSFTIDDELLISIQIVDSPWFMASWNNDPTVSAMLNMLDTLQEEFTNIPEAWQNLTEKNKITFDFIDIKSDEFKLTDELYIKMNSRGKPLTPFENFKAQFAGLLASDKTDYVHQFRRYENTEVTYQQYFAFKIDSKWMDLFWNYRKKTKINVDSTIYRFINFVAEFLFFRENSEAVSTDVKLNFEFLNNVFSKKENIDFLYDSLDFLSSLEDVSIFFDEIFGDLSTFDHYQKDYFLRAITDAGFDVQDKSILYAILNICNKLNIRAVNDDLKDFVRIIRNLLLTVRQPNQKKRIEYSTNLRLPSVSEYCKFIDALVHEKVSADDKSFYGILSEKTFTGFTAQNILNEKSKAKLIIEKPALKETIFQLEEHYDLQGNLSVFKLDSDNIESKFTAFLSIWTDTVNHSLIIRAMLSIGDYSVMTHQSSLLGDIYFFGCKGSWNRILTTGDKDERIQVASVLDKFLMAFSEAEGNNTSEKLQFLIDSFEPEERDWLYYFVKYKRFTDNPNLTENVFAWNGEGFEINSLGNSGKQPLHSYHLSPYLTTLRSMLASHSKIEHYYGRFADVSYIKVDQKIHIRSTILGWEISPLNGYTIDEAVIEKYNITENATRYILSETDEKDRIEIVYDFVNDILLL